MVMSSNKPQECSRDRDVVGEVAATPAPGSRGESGRSAQASMFRASLKGQRGFTLIELLAVMAIMGILAGVVAGAVTGLGNTSQETRLAGDENTIGKAADRFFTDAFPQTYPVVDLDTDGDGDVDTDDDFELPGGDLEVRVVDFDATLPQDGTLSFVPDFLKEVPDSAAVVSWRVDQTTGNVFFTEDGAALVKPSLARLDVKATDPNDLGGTESDIRVQSNQVLTLAMRKDEAPINIIKMTIPAGYVIGGQQLAADAKVGELVVKFDADNPWDTGNKLTVATADVLVVSANEWSVDVTYDTNTGGTSANIDVKNTVSGEGADDRTHTISIVPPAGTDSPGKLNLTLDRDTTDGVTSGTDYDDLDVNESTEVWTLTLFGTDGTDGVGGNTNLITNPGTTGVFRWLAEENTAIDIEDTFDGMAGNQAVVIR